MIWNNNGGFESLRKRPFQVILGFDIIVILLALSNSFFDPNNPQEAFVGWAFTLISGSQLLFIGLISWNIQIKRMKEVGEEKRNSRYIWFIIGMGFVFLALDEAFELHEEIDFLIHNRFGIEETGLSDRIDDLVVMTYFIIGMVFLYLSRTELMRFTDAFEHARLAVVLVIVMMTMDVFANRKDVLSWFIHDEDWCYSVFKALNILEESAKLLAGGVILATGISCRTISIQLQGPHAPLLDDNVERENPTEPTDTEKPEAGPPNDDPTDTAYRKDRS